VKGSFSWERTDVAPALKRAASKVRSR
jgi:hypothetical protein